MFSTTMTLQAATMTPKPLTHAAPYDIRRPDDGRAEADFHPVHMDWIVVTDTKGNRRLQIRWQAKR